MMQEWVSKPTGPLAMEERHAVFVQTATGMHEIPLPWIQTRIDLLLQGQWVVPFEEITRVVIMRFRPPDRMDEIQPFGAEPQPSSFFIVVASLQS
jgi:hypothetical protein